MSTQQEKNKQKKIKTKNHIFDRFLAIFGRFWLFWPFWAVFGRFWPFLNYKMSESMSYTLLARPTTRTTLYFARIVQKFAQNVQKCAQNQILYQILAKKRVFDPPKKKIIFFFQQKWIPHEKLDIKHVFYDYLLALNIIFKVVKRKGSTALSNYT